MILLHLQIMTKINALFLTVDDLQNIIKEKNDLSNAANKGREVIKQLSPHLNPGEFADKDLVSITETLANHKERNKRIMAWYHMRRGPQNNRNARRHNPAHQIPKSLRTRLHKREIQSQFLPLHLFRPCKAKRS